MSLLKLLETIQQRPGIFLGAPSVSGLQMFLGGYFFARHEQGLAVTIEEEIFEGFQKWVEQRFKVQASVSWAKIILLYSANEQRGFELFFELWEEFLGEELWEKILEKELREQVLVLRQEQEQDIEDYSVAAMEGKVPAKLN